MKWNRGKIPKNTKLYREMKSNLLKNRYNRKGETKPRDLMAEFIKSLKDNPLWLLGEICTRCENFSTYLWRFHVYLCSSCYEKLRAARLQVLVEYPMTAYELYQLQKEKEKAKEKPSP